MRRSLAGVIGTLVLATAAAPAAHADTHFRSEALLPQLHVLTQGDAFHVQPRGNVSIIEQQRGVVLVDSGGSPAGADEVIAAVRALTRKPVVAIVLTHWHGDHVLGVSRLLAEWPTARVIATRATRDALADPATDRYMPGSDDAANARFVANVREGVAYLSGQARAESLSAAERDGFAVAAAEYETFATEMTAARRLTPTETFDRQCLLPDRVTPVEVEFLGRANTAGDALVRLPRQGVVISGDVVVAPVPFGADTYPSEWIEVLRTLRGTRFKLLVPGHGMPQRDTRYVDALIDELESVRAQVSSAAASTLDAHAISASLPMDAFHQRVVHGDPWLQRWYLSYWQEPLVASLLHESRGEASH